MPATEKAGARPGQHATALLAEADRLMTVCNSCRYCEGLCAVFPAMEMRRTFASGDLNYLANLCHNCSACYYDCQFSPPHEFDVNVPRVLAEVRNESYQAYAWPRAFAGAFERNGLTISIVTALSVAAFILGFVAFRDPSVLFATHAGPGAFYRLMPHNSMALLFGVAFLYAIVAMGMGLRMFWRDIGEPPETLREPRSLWQAMKDAGSLRYLDGGGVGCMNEDERPTDNCRVYHHLTFYGFMLCFAATSVATVYHYALGWSAPYPFWSAPVLLGTAGGLGLVIGPLGLLWLRGRRDPALAPSDDGGMDIAFLLLLLMAAASGLALLAMREMAGMPIVLVLHLAIVMALFLTVPYGKGVHGVYRLVALLRYHLERRRPLPELGSE